MVQVKGTLGAASTLTITLTSLPNNAGRVATQFNGGADFPIKGWISVLVKTGTSAPTSGSLLEFYLAFSDAQTTENNTDGLSLVDSAISTKPKNIRPIGSIAMTQITSYDHRNVMPVFDLPQKWSLIIWNSTGASLSSTGSHHVVKFVPQYDETV